MFAPAVFAPLKKQWRAILSDYKLATGSTGLPKEMFPKLLKKLMLKFAETGEQNLQSGFRATGIYPLDRNQILKKLPGTDDTKSNESFGNSLNDTVIQFLRGIRNKKAARTQRKKKINIAPGKSIGLEDFEIGESSGCSVPTKNKKKSAKELDSDSFDYELELFLFCDEIHQENEEIERPTGAAAVNDYVLVRFATKKTLKFCVGLIKEDA